MGYIHIYTGDGKGKSTAAFGLALRRLCAGGRVYVGQFIRSMKYNETKSETLFEGLTIEQFGRGCFIEKNPEQVDIDMACRGLERCIEAMRNGEWDMVILDEATIAVYYNLFGDDDLIAAIGQRAECCEVVITGRYASAALIEVGDVVTSMEQVKHYYEHGVQARDGIER